MKGEAGIFAGTGAGERGLDGLPGAGEDGEDPVAEELAFDGCAGVIADDGSERGVEFTGLLAEGGIAEALGERGGVSDVGEEDDGGAGRRHSPMSARLKRFEEGGRAGRETSFRCVQQGR